MAGKFINHNFTNTVDVINDTMVNRVKNANYMFNNLSPVITESWYNINDRSTTLDNTLRVEYSDIGMNSGIRYNKIKNAVFYSSSILFDTSNLEFDESGLSISKISITGIILPNTWIPYTGDYMNIKHAGKDWLFKITSTSFDTIDTGNNVYSFTAVMSNYGTSQLDKQVDYKYKMIVNNVGTGFKTIIKEDDYITIEYLDGVYDKLLNYYSVLFFNPSIAGVCFNGKYGNLYDPYMTEFLIRNKIFSNGNEYKSIMHQTNLPAMFQIYYDKSIFRSLERCNIDSIYNMECVATLIEQDYSLFAALLDDYFEITYIDTKKYTLPVFQMIDPQLIYNIKNNVIIDATNDNKRLYNIIVTYMNDNKLADDFDRIMSDLEYVPESYLFYTIPMVLYIINESVKKLIE